MRDARILAWLLADPQRAGQLSLAQWSGVVQVACAEGLAAELFSLLDGSDVPEEARSALSLAKDDCVLLPLPDAGLVEEICLGATQLFTHGALEQGLRRLWRLNLFIRSGRAQAGFWDDLLHHARSQSVTPHVSRALRLCHHLFETPVDRFLAWQGQRSDVYFIGRILARDGQGEETARWLRRAFRLRAWWLARAS